MGEDAKAAEKTKVIVRIRPLLPHELQRQSVVAAYAVDEASISLQHENGLRSASSQYDHVLGPDATQQQVYGLVKECTASVLEGINSTVFAYGQTGSGKTHTMFGADAGDGAGVVPRVLQELFDYVEQQELVSLTAYCSFIQVYNEQVYDMLRDPHLATPLTIREDKGRETYVQGLSEYAMRSINDCMELLAIAQHNRAIRETRMNQASSRSHSIFQITVQQKRRDENGAEVTRQAKYNLVDLAGSEKWDTSVNLVDAHVAELTNINLSLHTLGRCITALSKGAARVHVPYRDSKLTRLLQDSLGGNAKTFLVAAISPGADCFDESLSTLRFASVASKIEVRATVNESHSAEQAIIAQLQSEIQQLRAALARLTAGDEASSDGKRPADVIMSLEQELQREKRNNSELTARLNFVQKQAAKVVESDQPEQDQTKPRTTPAVSVNEWLIADLAEHLKTTTASMRQLKALFDGFKSFEIEEDQLHEQARQIFTKAELEKNEELLLLVQADAAAEPAVDHVQSQSIEQRQALPQISAVKAGIVLGADVLQTNRCLDTAMPSDRNISDALELATGLQPPPGRAQLPQLPLRMMSRSSDTEAASTAHDGDSYTLQHTLHSPTPKRNKQQFSPIRDSPTVGLRSPVKALPPGKSPAAGVITAGFRPRASQPIHVPFRVRDRGRQDNGWLENQEADDDDERIQREIKQLRKKLQKQAELQDWMKRKEAQSMEALRADEERRKALLHAHEAREQKRQQRHLTQKRRLKEYYARVQAQLSDSTNFATQLAEAARARVHGNDLEFYLSSASSADAGGEASFFQEHDGFDLSD